MRKIIPILGRRQHFKLRELWWLDRRELYGLGLRQVDTLKLTRLGKYLWERIIELLNRRSLRKLRHHLWCLIRICRRSRQFYMSHRRRGSWRLGWRRNLLSLHRWFILRRFEWNNNILLLIKVCKDICKISIRSLIIEINWDLWNARRGDFWLAGGRIENAYEVLFRRLCICLSVPTHHWWTHRLKILLLLHFLLLSLSFLFFSFSLLLHLLLLLQLGFFFFLL